MVKIINELNKQNINYLLVKIKDNDLSVLDKKLLIEIENSDYIINEFIEDKNVFCYGTKYISNIIYNKYPSISCQNNLLDCQYMPFYFRDNILNTDMVVADLFFLEPKEERFFIRPLKNNKLINGMIMTKKELKILQEKEKNNINSKFINNPLIISSLKDIKEEYRFFVYNKEIIASSSYKPTVNEKIDNKCYQFVEKMIKKFPLNHYVIDIALLSNNEYKVIELNNINTSGLYNIDVETFVKKIK